MNKFLDWGWCENGDGSLNLQLLCGLFCSITFKALEILLFVPWTAYKWWKIDAKYDLIKPSIGVFIWMRLTILLEFMLTMLPIALLIVKVIEWTGNYVSIVFFCATSLVQSVMLFIYPKLIDPLQGTTSEVPEYA